MLGTRHFSAGRYNDALAQLRLAEQLSARNPEIARQTVLWLGDTYYALGDYDAAEKQYRSYVNRAQRNDPNLPLATYNLGYALFGRREYAAARDRLVSAAKSTSLSAATRADAHNRIADTYYYEHKFQDALDNYGKAYDTNRSTGDYAALQSAMMLGHLGRKSDKVKALDRMTGEFPQSSLVPSALTEKALTLSSMGKRADAISVYRSLSDDHPSTSQGRNALLQLAILSANDRDRDQAITYYKKVISSYPSSAEASMAVEDLTRIYGEMGAIEQLHEFLSSVKGAPQLDSVEFNAIASAALLKKASGARDAGQLDSALVHATDLLDRFPDSESAEKALAIKADVELTQGKTEPALNDYMALADCASTPAMSHRARMGILRSARDLGRSDLIDLHRRCHSRLFGRSRHRYSRSELPAGLRVLRHRPSGPRPRDMGRNGPYSGQHLRHACGVLAGRKLSCRKHARRCARHCKRTDRRQPTTPVLGRKDLHSPERHTPGQRIHI